MERADLGRLGSECARIHDVKFLNNKNIMKTKLKVQDGCGMPAIPSVRIRPEDCEFKIRMKYIVLLVSETLRRKVPDSNSMQTQSLYSAAIASMQGSVIHTTWQ